MRGNQRSTHATCNWFERRAAMNGRTIKHWVLMAPLALLSMAGFGVAHAGTPIKVCDDDAGWPPYTYVDPKNPPVVIGASADLMREILTRAGYEPQIKLLPWKR